MSQEQPSPDEIASTFVEQLKKENRQARTEQRVDEAQYQQLQALLKREIIALSQYSAIREG